MKKILIIQGGGRPRGNTAQLVEQFMKGVEEAVSYYRFTLINYIGFHDKGMLLAGDCGDTNGKPHIGETTHLEEARKFGKELYL